MDDHFTNNSDAVYLASLTQGKKIIFLERELINAEHYTKNLEQSLEASRLTLNRLIKDRTNHEILAKMTESLYHMERRCREMQELLKESNAKLLIEMQLRIQEKAEYHEKVRELEQEIDLIRKNNKDKEQEFTIVVNKLRKYEDIRELVLEEKLSKETKKNVTLKEDDKEEIIKDLSEELNLYKKMSKHERVDMDKKIAVLQYAMECNESYEAVKHQFVEILNHPNKTFQNQREQYEKMILSKNSFKDNKNKISHNINDNTKELLKQIKKLVISNKLLEAALYESIEKNEELIFNSQILIDSNLEMKEKINEYRKNEHAITRRKKNSLPNSKDIYLVPQKQSISTSSNGKGSKELKKTDNLNFILGFSESEVYRESRESHDDIGIVRTEQMNLVEMVRERELKEYLENLKSKDYEVNVEELYKDVNKVSEFLILSLGTRSKNVESNVPTYSSIMRKQDNKREIRSISSDLRRIEKPTPVYDNMNSKRSSTSKQENERNGLMLSKIMDANGDLKEESFHIEEY